jgi:hypothetical protein
MFLTEDDALDKVRMPFRRKILVRVAGGALRVYLDSQARPFNELAPGAPSTAGSQGTPCGPPAWWAGAGYTFLPSARFRAGITPTARVLGGPPFELEINMTKRELKAMNAELIELLAQVREQIDDKLEELTEAAEDAEDEDE